MIRHINGHTNVPRIGNIKCEIRMREPCVQRQCVCETYPPWPIELPFHAKGFGSSRFRPKHTAERGAAGVRPQVIYVRVGELDLEIPGRFARGVVISKQTGLHNPLRFNALR